MPKIHPTALVEEGARIAAGAEIGPFTIIGPEVKIGEGSVVGPHCVIQGRTEIGARNRIHQAVSIGDVPQDLKYGGEASAVRIGDDNTIREFVTVQPGSEPESVTSIGDDNLLMAYVHIAHNCQLRNRTVLANAVNLAGYVSVEDFAIIGGVTPVHQFVRIGRHAIVGGMSGVGNDLIPYGSAVGNRAHLSGLNIIGLKRRGFPRDVIHDLRRAYRLIFAQEGTMTERLIDVAELMCENEPAMEIVDFIRTDSSRAICQPKLEDAA